MTETYNVLSVEAWRSDLSWTWNNWWNIGLISRQVLSKLTSDRAIIKWFRDEGYLSEFSKGKVKLEHDGYNIVVCEKGNGCPLFAIVVGE